MYAIFFWIVPWSFLSFLSFFTGGTAVKVGGPSGKMIVVLIDF